MVKSRQVRSRVLAFGAAGVAFAGLVALAPPRALATTSPAMATLQAVGSTPGPTPGSTPGPTVGPTPGGCTPAQLLGNPGFETGTAAPWVATAGVISKYGAPPHTGSWEGWLDGYGATHTDTLSQTVLIPARCTRVTLSFWLHVNTAETATTWAYDTLTVTAGGTTLATYSNLNAAAGYTQKSFSLTGVAGTAVTIKLTGVEDSSLKTSFVVDDFALTVS